MNAYSEDSTCSTVYMSQLLNGFWLNLILWVYTKIYWTNSVLVHIAPTKLLH